MQPHQRRPQQQHLIIHKELVPQHKNFRQNHQKKVRKIKIKKTFFSAYPENLAAFVETLAVSVSILVGVQLFHQIQTCVQTSWACHTLLRVR